MTDIVGEGEGMSQDMGASVISAIVRISQAIGCQAGVGAMETAGSIVSYLHEHPEDLPKLLDGTLSVIDWPVSWHQQGCLSWQGADGKVHHPASRVSQ